jgi:hypothetical protein
VGQSAFAAEQAAVSAAAARAAQPALCAAAHADGAPRDEDRGCDILVCTPGRLTDHLDATRGFAASLQHLRFLAVDEADRLLAESYQDWARRVNAAVFTAPWSADRMTYARGGGGGGGGSGGADGGAVDAPGRTRALSRAPAQATSRLATADAARVGNLLTPEPWALHEGGAAADAGAARRRRGPVVLALPAWANEAAAAAAPEGERGLAEGGARATVLPVPFRRIVLSATLTANPQKLAALGLVRPRYFVSTRDVRGARASAGAAGSAGAVEAGGGGGDDDDDDDDDGDDDGDGEGGDVGGGEGADFAATGADGRRVYALPASLHQTFCVVGAAEKPTALIYLLRLLEGQRADGEAGAGGAASGAAPAPVAAAAAAAGLRAVVFAGSVDTTHRLTRLLQLFGGLRGRVVEFSAALSQAKRSAILAAARAGVIGVLVSSDAAARGLDLPSLPCVVQYDVAPRVKAYVHRVGRAARAGRVGLSVSLVRPDQARHFRLLLARTASPRGPAGRAVKEALQGSVVRAYAPRMQAVLTRLQALLEEERAAGGGAAETRPVEALPAKA